MTRSRALRSLALLLSLLAAACGGEEPAATATEAPIATATAAPAEPTASTEAPVVTATAAPVEPTANTEAPVVTATAAPVEPTASTGATPRDELPVIEFLRGDGSVVPLSVEVPPRQEYSIGLSGRHTLGDRGMIFAYAREGRTPFWMKNTHVDLSIAFIGADFRIVEIREMEAESLEYIIPERDYRYAVEAPAAWYGEHGVEVGDLARFTFDLPG